MPIGSHTTKRYNAKAMAVSTTKGKKRDGPLGRSVHSDFLFSVLVCPSNPRFDNPPRLTDALDVYRGCDRNGAVQHLENPPLFCLLNRQGSGTYGTRLLPV